MMVYMAQGNYCKLPPRVDYLDASADQGRYVCYESIVTIVKSHYGMSDDATELDARKSLTTALLELSLLES